jgi:hypothetical protein
MQISLLGDGWTWQSSSSEGAASPGTCVPFARSMASMVGLQITVFRNHRPPPLQPRRPTNRALRRVVLPERSCWSYCSGVSVKDGTVVMRVKHHPFIRRRWRRWLFLYCDHTVVSETSHADRGSPFPPLHISPALNYSIHSDWDERYSNLRPNSVQQRRVVIRI